MFGRKRKKGLRDQVRSQVGPQVDHARDQIAPLIADARKKAGPVISDARDKAAPYVSDARDAAAPYVSEARDRFVNDVVPAVSAAVSDARDKAAPYVAEAREEGKRRGKATAAALKGEVDAPKKSHKLRKLLLAGGVIGLGVFVFKKLTGGDDSASSWQSSYTPPAPPAPTPPATANKPPAPSAATQKAAPVMDDKAGASPDEAASDTAEAGPHPVTMPDNPVEKTDVSKDTDPKP